MTIPHWHEEPITRAHDRDDFDCGDTVLNTFLRLMPGRAMFKAGLKRFSLSLMQEANRFLAFTASVRPLLPLTVLLNLSGTALLAMKCRCSGLQGWPWIVRYKDAAWAVNFFSPQVGVASRLHHR